MDTVKFNKSDLDFPAHLSDPIRIEIATELMQKEAGKLLPSVSPAQLNSDIGRWWAEPQEFMLAKLVDFWDAADAVMGGIKLKSIIAMVTAANYDWSEQTIPLDQVKLLSKLDQLNRLPGLTPENLELAAIKDIFDKNPEEKAEQKGIVDSFSQKPTQNDYKIVVVKSAEGLYRVHDGNRRALRALLHDQTTINAWVCETHEQNPKDYWVPISLMLSLVKQYRHNSDNQQLVESLRAVLANYFAESKSAKAAYRQRILNWEPHGAKELSEGLL